MTPRQFIDLVKRKLPRSGLAREYFISAALGRTFHSKMHSMKSMASALRAWAAFCSLCGISHFPVSPQWAAAFAATCRDPGTFKNYICHIRASCEFLALPTSWSQSPEMYRARLGLEKQALVFKGPRLSAPADAMLSVACFSKWHPERL